jgi:hypothetical protein
MRLPAVGKLSRRALIVSAFSLVLVAALATALTTKIAVSHYQAEHASAVRALDEHAELTTDKGRLQDLSEQRLVTIQRLETRLANNSNDLRYAVSRWHFLQGQVATLRSTTTSLRDDVAAANSKVDSSYNSGYQAGLADASSTFSAGTDSSTDECDPNYEGACVPTGVGDVDCGDLVETDFDVVGYDVDGLDGDGDGIACESY